MAYLLSESVAEDNQADGALSKISLEKPGGLRGESWMTIQTHQAQALVLGRKKTASKEAIIGLLDFGRRMRVLWLSARADDPFADWFMVQIEASMHSARSFLLEKTGHFEQVLNSMAGIDVSVAQSVEPLRLQLVFNNPYGYQGAYLVTDFDRLCRSVLTALHVGLINRKQAYKILENAGRPIRKTFELAARWKFTGVTRDDLRVKNQNAVRAIGIFGECPDPIARGEKRASISPEIPLHRPVGSPAESTAGPESTTSPDQAQAIADSEEPITVRQFECND